MGLRTVVTSWIDRLRAKWRAQEAAIRAKWQAEEDRIAAEEAERRKPKPPPPEKRTDRPRRKWALVVYVNRYMGRGDRNLRGCETDHDRMCARLKRAGYEVVSLGDFAATKAAIVAALRGAIAWAETGDTIALVFSGHGTLLPDLRDPDGEVSALCCTECLQDNSTSTFVNGCITSMELRDLLAALPRSASFWAFIDACHGGHDAPSFGALFGARGIIEDPTSYRVPRFLPPPSELVRPKAKMLNFMSTPRDIVRVEGSERRLIWAMCRAKETSSDAYIDGVYAGAGTDYILKADTANPRATIAEMNEAAASALQRDSYGQTPVASATPPERLSERVPWAVEG